MSKSFDFEYTEVDTHFNKIVESGRIDWSIEKNASFWNEQARLDIEQILTRKENRRVAKNVILFLGDGMGISTITAGRIRKGQVNGQLGEDHNTEMEQFFNLGLAKTYNIDHQTPDSAATATAFLCGVKAQLGTVGLDGRGIRNNCPSSIGTHVDSILDWAQKLGKKVGIITTARITHATPAAAYAHVPERNWESFDGRNFNATHATEGCTDIAHQLAARTPPIDLLLGGGRQFFYPTTTFDIEYPSKRGSRIDNRSLIEELWKGKYIWNMTEMNKFELGSSQPLLGLFEPSHMRYELNRSQSNDDEPSLSRMTEFAIEHFLKSEKGFMLLIEGGRIDHAHHDTQPRNALDEFVEFDNAVGQAKRTLQAKGALDDTLIVVTADHSHVFTMGAYSSRGSNILGFGSLESMNISNIDQLPVNIIAYGNGPNFNSPRNATYFNSLNTNSTDYRAPAALPLSVETHGGEDVAVYAHGPWSHLFIGTYEQHTIAHKMAYAACLGAYETRDGCSKASSPRLISKSLLVFFFLFSFFDAFLHTTNK
ncbi:unnamed protein product [Rotaria socialis]|uniref:Alkaline phosphatase, tissue-nonspecific isozyme n=1 Tax=Rotaria socialis TaxID=392032 RepID=A0A821ELF8_9BILA|nr:unnamed protein product [Rotaria socialis]CAF4892022.1 unnamed protein product [Rotaria socialis]